MFSPNPGVQATPVVYEQIGTPTSSISAIESHIETYKKNPPESLPEKAAALEKLFAELILMEKTPATQRALAEVLLQYSRAHYPKFKDTKALYGYSLTYALAQLNPEFNDKLPIPLEKVRSLNNLKYLTTSDFHSAPHLEKFLTHEGKDFLLQADKPLPFIYEIASGYRWFGHCMQNIDSYKEPEKLVVKEHVYWTCEQALKNIIADLESSPKELSSEDIAEFNGAANKELTELYYNSWPHLQYARNGGDVNDAVATLDLALERDKSDSMRARVLNSRGCWYRDKAAADLKIALGALAAGRNEEAAQAQKASQEANELSFKLISESFELRMKMADNNPFLFANSKNSFAKFLMEKNPKDLTVPERLLTEAVDYAKEELGKGNYHPYYAFYYQGMATLETLRDNPEKALVNINESIALLEREPDSYKDTLESYKKQREEILSKLN